VCPQAVEAFGALRRGGARDRWRSTTNGLRTR
jgi:hypothetical protein